MSLSREVEIVQNAALGAVLQWKFCHGYSPQDGELRGTPLPLIFLVLPVCYTAILRDVVERTRQASGLRKFEEKLRADGADRVWSINDRAIAYRELTRKSLSVAIATKLVRMDTGAGTLWVAKTGNPRGIPTEIAPMLRAAERLGAWCGEYSLDEIAAILRMPL
jgi:hypothetical protein